MTGQKDLESMARKLSNGFNAGVSTVSYTRPNPCFSGEKHWTAKSSDGMHMVYRFNNETEYFCILKGAEGRLMVVDNGIKVTAFYHNPLMSDSSKFFAVPPEETTDTRENHHVIRHLKRIMIPHIEPYDDQDVTLDLSLVQYAGILKIADFLASKLNDIPDTL